MGLWHDALPMDPTDGELVAAVQGGDIASFELLIKRYQSRVFATARRYARREDEVEDIVQESFIKAYQKLHTFRGVAPFEHWLMRVSVRVCYDFLRKHQKNRETPYTDIDTEDTGWLERLNATEPGTTEHAEAAQQLVARLLECLSPENRMIITMLQIEERSLKEIAEITGWSVTLVKVRAFRARAQMRKWLEKLAKEKYL
jgi:RNA polymerase sigma-70 factor, ECF subfamily